MSPLTHISSRKAAGVVAAALALVQGGHVPQRAARVRAEAVPSAPKGLFVVGSRVPMRRAQAPVQAPSEIITRLVHVAQGALAL